MYRAQPVSENVTNSNGIVEINGGRLKSQKVDYRYVEVSQDSLLL